MNPALSKNPANEPFRGGVRPTMPCRQAASVAARFAAEKRMVVRAQSTVATRVGRDVLRKAANCDRCRRWLLGYAWRGLSPAGTWSGGGLMTIQLAEGAKTFIAISREQAHEAATAQHVPGKDGQRDQGREHQAAMASAGVVPGRGRPWNTRLAWRSTAEEDAGQIMRAFLSLAEQGFARDQGDVTCMRTATDEFKADAHHGEDLPNNGNAVKQGEDLGKGPGDTLSEMHGRSRRFLQGKGGRGIVGQAAGQGHPRAGRLAPVQARGWGR